MNEITEISRVMQYHWTRHGPNLQDHLIHSINCQEKWIMNDLCSKKNPLIIEKGYLNKESKCLILNHISAWEEDIKHLMKEETKLLKTLLFAIRASPFFSDASLAEFYGMASPSKSYKLSRGGRFNVAFNTDWYEESNLF